MLIIIVVVVIVVVVVVERCTHKMEFGKYTLKFIPQKYNKRESLGLLNDEQVLRNMGCVGPYFGVGVQMNIEAGSEKFNKSIEQPTGVE